MKKIIVSFIALAVCFPVIVNAGNSINAPSCAKRKHHEKSAPDFSQEDLEIIFTLAQTAALDKNMPTKEHKKVIKDILYKNGVYTKTDIEMVVGVIVAILKPILIQTELFLKDVITTIKTKKPTYSMLRKKSEEHLIKGHLLSRETVERLDESLIAASEGKTIVVNGLGILTREQTTLFVEALSNGPFRRIDALFSLDLLSL